MSDYNENEFETWHWRNTMKPAKFFFLDAMAMFPWVIVLVYARTTTVAFAILVTTIFWMVEKKGYTVTAALRALRVFIIGNNRPAIYWYRRRKLLDTGSR